MVTCLPKKENISVYEADDCKLEFTTDIGDITGYSIKLQARETTSSRYAVIDVDGEIKDAINGIYTVNFPSKSTLGKSTDRALYYDIKLTAPSGDVHTDRYGMLDIEPRTTDLDSAPVSYNDFDIKKDGSDVTTDAKGIDFKGQGFNVVNNNGFAEVSITPSGLEILKDGVDVDSDVKKLNLQGSNLNIQSSGGVATLSVTEKNMPVTIGAHFVGIYDTLKDLQDAIPKPSDNYQAIVLSPSEKYYHSSGGQFIEFAPLGAIHPSYIGAYDTLGDLAVAVPSPNDDDLVIVGTSSKEFYYYGNGKWNEINEASLPALVGRMDVAEQHIQTLQTQNAEIKKTADKAASDVASIYAPDETTFNAKVDERLSKPKDDIKALQLTTAGHTQELNVIGSEVKNLQDNQFNGIHVEDVDNNSFNDIDSIIFDGADVSNQQGTKTARVVVKPKLTVANGQAPDSTSATGNAFIIKDATISVDPNDKNVVHIGVSSLGNGIIVGDGVSASREVKRVTLNGYPIHGSGDTAEIHLKLNNFKNLSERDAWSNTFGNNISYDVIAIVDSDENGFVQFYKFNAATKKWSEYDAQGVIMSDSSGAIPKNIKTVVFGDGFSVQQAGNQEDAALVTYSGSSSTGMTIDGKVITELNTLPPLKTVNEQGQDRIIIDPNAYESQHGKSCLVKLGADKYVKGSTPTSVYCDDEIVPFGEYFSPNVAKHGINVQDTTGDDPSITGGQLTEVLASVGFFDKAPEDGNVKVWIEYHNPATSFAPEILKDVNGHPMIFERLYKQGDSLEDVVLFGGMLATGLAPIILRVETSFSSGNIVELNPEKTMIGVNQFSDGYETSIARIEFQRRLGVNIIPSMFKFTKDFARLSSAIEGVSLSESVVNAGEGMDTINSFGINNLTDVKAAIGSGAVKITDNNKIADFYMDYQLDSDRTEMVKGKELSLTVTIKNTDNAFIIAMYYWNGKGDRQSKLYNSRNNNVIVVEDGWNLIKSDSIAELPSGDFQSKSITGTVPDDATNVGFFVYPVVAESPCVLEISDFVVGAEKDFTGYIDKSYSNLHEEHLRFDVNYAEFALSNGDFSGLRYTINNTQDGNPMPVGKISKGKLDAVVDNSINKVSGSADPENDGAIKFNSDGQASISHTYRVCNETGTDSTVKFWDLLFDVDGNPTKIAESEREFTVKANTVYPGVILTIPAYVVEVEKGQRIGSRASSNKDDGAFIESKSKTDLMVQTIVEFDEFKSSSDTTDLISSPMDKKLVVDRRVYEFTGNTSSNISINLDIPADVELANHSVVVKKGDSYMSLDSADFMYDTINKVLTVGVNSNAEGKVYLEFWG